uniref:Uncharacterized protein n=1 Tax=Trichobilharzia regenti TaxID=157069 RepID=A0AA85J4P3_TRIRE
MECSILYIRVNLPPRLLELVFLRVLLSPFSFFSLVLHDLSLSNESNFVKYAGDLTVSLPVMLQCDCSKLNCFLSV